MSHLLLCNSAFSAPIAAKQGGVNRLNMRYASAAAFVSPITAATVPPPLISSSSSVSIKLLSAYTVAMVPTTFSLAIKPAITAAASCHAANPTIGINIYENGAAIAARIEVPSIPSSTG